MRVGAGATRLGAALLALALTAAAPPGARIGIEMPAAGDDGGAGLAATAALRLGLGGRAVVRDSANGGVLNPHEDEGRDNVVDQRLGPRIVAAFAADPSVVAAVGGLRRSVGDADAAVAGARGLPLIVLARWSPAAPGRGAYCLCASPPQLAAFAAATARARFGARLLVVLAGEAAALRGLWPGRLGPAVSTVGDGTADVAAARRRARGADAVLLLADERPPTLWRAAAFARRFDLEYLRALRGRGGEAVPAGTRRGDALLVAGVLPQSPARAAFAGRFHTAAGFQPDEAATRAYAAAQILRGAGASRAAVAGALAKRRFDTIAGAVSFDADGFWRGARFAATEP
ncbi:MAG: Periplasmic binding protein [Candidatus Eremiobacteraeota bacterium]|jgi:hypothetical protein|nr:Periplasmic binding protein [Candidatus Eremiobacteraeota bacterium]